MSSAFLGYFDKSITSHVLDTVMCFYNTKYNNLLLNVDKLCPTHLVANYFQCYQSCKCLPKMKDTKLTMHKLK